MCASYKGRRKRARGCFGAQQPSTRGGVCNANGACGACGMTHSHLRHVGVPRQAQYRAGPNLPMAVERGGRRAALGLSEELVVFSSHLGQHAICDLQNAKRNALFFNPTGVLDPKVG